MLIPGDVADAEHRRQLVQAAGETARPARQQRERCSARSPQPPLATYPLEELRRVYEANVLAPLALVQLALPHLREGGRIVNVISDAAVEAYEGWGGYGSSKAALAQISAVLAVEHPGLRVYAVDPGDMRTQMQQDAFPGEDISDRPPPEESVPGLLALVEGDLPSGLYRARDLVGGLGMSVPAVELPARLEAHEPPEARGLGRDGVRLLVSDRSDGSIAHRRFRDLPRFLSPGDLLVLNTSATLPAAVPAKRADGTELELRFSTPEPGHDENSRWIVELRRGDAPFAGGEPGELLTLPGGGTARILVPFTAGRLWLARLELPQPLERFLAEHGRPIRYDYVPRRWPLSAYQNVYALEPGSAEMASAGRPLTAELLTRLVAGGVLVAPVTLHTGVSSPERHEPPYPERFHVPAADRPARERRPRLGRSRDRNRDDGRPRARDGRATRRHGRSGQGLDEPRRHAGARPLDGRRPPHRPARAGGLSSRPAARRRRRGADRAELRRGGRARLPLARVRRQPPHPQLDARAAMCLATCSASLPTPPRRADVNPKRKKRPTK